MLQDLTVATPLTPAVLSLEEAAGGYARASKSAATRKAYQTDAADFTAWCDRHGLEALPASVSTVAAYLAGLAKEGLKASTITRRCAGIRYMHRMAGFEPPTSHEAIKAVLARHSAISRHGGDTEGTGHGGSDPRYAAGHA